MKPLVPEDGFKVCAQWGTDSPETPPAQAGAALSHVRVIACPWLSQGPPAAPSLCWPCFTHLKAALKAALHHPSLLEKPCLNNIITAIWQQQRWKRNRSFFGIKYSLKIGASSSWNQISTPEPISALQRQEGPPPVTSSSSSPALVLLCTSPITLHSVFHSFPRKHQLFLSFCPGKRYFGARSDDDLGDPPPVRPRACLWPRWGALSCPPRDLQFTEVSISTL